MNITFISDTHNLHEKLNPYLLGGDVLVHCGDVTTHGTREEAFRFMKWFNKLPYARKVFIAGNHDYCFDDAKTEIPITYEELDFYAPNVDYLVDQLIYIGNMGFYGSAYTPMFQNMAFNETEEQLKQRYAWISMTTDVLITHGPPRKILDWNDNREHLGSESLFEKAKSIRPKIHAFGHIHERYGVRNSNWGTKFINASNHTWLWKGTPYQPPITVEI